MEEKTKAGGEGDGEKEKKEGASIEEIKIISPIKETFKRRRTQKG